jgi:hypothetical protein
VALDDGALEDSGGRVHIKQLGEIDDRARPGRLREPVVTSRDVVGVQRTSRVHLDPRPRATAILRRDFRAPIPLDEREPGTDGPMAQNRAVSERQDRGPFATGPAEHPMPDREDATVDAVQAPRVDAPCDRGPAEA